MTTATYTNAFTALRVALGNVLAAQLPAGVHTVTDDDRAPLPADKSRGVLLRIPRRVPQLGGDVMGAPLDWTIEITADCYARRIASDGNATAQDDADELAALVHATVMQADHAAIGLNGIAPAEWGETELLNAAERLACTRISFAAHCGTTRDTLALVAP